MHFRARFFALIVIVLSAFTAFGDGVVTTPPPAVTRWELFDIKFLTRSSATNAAILTVGYLAGNEVTRTEELRVLKARTTAR